MNITKKRTNTIIEYLVEKQELGYCDSYGEPGYTDPEKSILFCNWNNVSNRISDYLEQAGFEIEWSDEWIIDYNNGKAYRTSPDSYDWQSQIRIDEYGDLLTPDSDIDEWIDYAAIDDYAQPVNALPDFIDMTKVEGWEKLNKESFVSGWHPGQNDNPQTIAKKVFSEGGYIYLIFQITNVSQFDMCFDLWGVKDD